MTCACGCGSPVTPDNRGRPRRYLYEHRPGGPRKQGATARAIHRRIERARGKAAEHVCVDCPATAVDWSYKLPVGFSEDPADYAPRCRRCHMRFDDRPAYGRRGDQ